MTEDLAVRAKDGAVAVAVEGCTGWRYMAEEIVAAGFEAHVAEPADTQAARGRKKHAKTDRSDARLLRELLASGDLPESWIPPEVVLEWRERVRLYKTLLDERRMWIQRIHAELFQHGVSVPEAQIGSAQTREWLTSDTVQLSTAARQRIAAGYHIMDAIDAVRLPLRADLDRFARRQPACKALAAAHYGIGPLTAVVVWAELGDCRRFSRSAQVVRHTGLDVTVDSSDRHRSRGHLSRQGPETLRWALFEAGMAASHATSPDREYYQATKQAHDGKLAAICMARKLARRCYHTLREMDPEVVYAMPT
ncbi:MAG: IS110 family transposase [Actinomycetota bacterium]|nr:IS110 family transposase [Actinomycetota bacterium]